MKFLIVLFSILNFPPLFSQQDELTASFLKPRRLEFGIVIAPGISYRTLVNHDTSSVGSAIIGIRNNNERPKISYTAGISLRYALSEKAGLSTGVYFASRGFRHKASNAFWPSQDTTGNFDPTSSSTLKSSYNFRFIEIPFMFDYTFHKSKLSYSIGIGGSYNYFLGSTFSYAETDANGEVHKGSSKDNFPYHQGNLSLIVKTGLAYSLSEKSSLHFDPTLHYDVTNLLSNVLVSEHLWDLGLNIGYFMAL